MFDVICVSARNYCTDFLQSIEEIAESSVKMIILREKDLSENEYYELAKEINKICVRLGKELVIHNFISVAEKLSIKKIHLSFSEFCRQNDLKNKFEVVGTSVHSVKDAKLAQSKKADYIIAGHIFTTHCKEGLNPRGINFLKNICDSVEIPVYAIGGINKDSVKVLGCIKKTNFAGVCIMSELMKSENPKKLINEIKINFSILNNKLKYLLYAVSDRRWLDGETLDCDIEKALRGGVTLLQLREKNLDFESFRREAEIIHRLCQKYDVPLIINDSVEVAKAVGAEGVHLGQNDETPADARKILGSNKIIGVTARSIEQAIEAERSGADYVGCGAVFGTATKSDAKKMSLETLRGICQAVSIPVVAIGGINKDNITELSGIGISGAAVVSGIFAEKDIESSTRELKNKIEAVVNEKQF